MTVPETRQDPFSSQGLGLDSGSLHLKPCPQGQCGMVGKCLGLRQLTWVQTSPLPLAGWVAVAYVLQFLHLQSEDTQSICGMWFLWGLKELIHVKTLGLCLLPLDPSITVSERPCGSMPCLGSAYAPVILHHFVPVILSALTNRLCLAAIFIFSPTRLQASWERERTCSEQATFILRFSSYFYFLKKFIILKSLKTIDLF